MVGVMRDIDSHGFPVTRTVRDPVLEGTWIVVARADEIGDQPFAASLLGERLVLWRDGDEVRAFKDLCIHRGTPLSLGRVEGSTLVCAYHGWRYDGSGRCTTIPAQPEGTPIPTKARALSYPCAVRYGLVWVAFETPTMPIPEHPEAALEDHRTLLCGPYLLEAEAPRVIENFLDVSHLMWVHEGYLGLPSHAEIPEHRVHQRGDRLVSDPITVLQPDPDGRGGSRTVPNHYVYEVLGPLTVGFRKVDLESDEVFSMLFQVTPIAQRRSAAFALLSRNYALDVEDRTFIEFQDMIIEQDRLIVESQRPEEIPLDLQAELHLKSDRLAIAYRRYLRQLGVTVGVA